MNEEELQIFYKELAQELMELDESTKLYIERRIEWEHFYKFYEKLAYLAYKNGINITYEDEEDFSAEFFYEDYYTLIAEYENEENKEYKYEFYLPKIDFYKYPKNFSISRFVKAILYQIQEELVKIMQNEE